MPVNILLIDDEPDFTSVLSKRLSKKGYSVSRADSGKEAIGMLNAGSPVDIAVLDVKMPGLNGLETLFHIKKLIPKVEVVMLSAYGTPQCLIECSRWGARYFLNKPVQFNELIEKIEATASGLNIE